MKYKINILTAVVTLLFCGCIKEQHDGSVASGDEVAVTLNLSVPAKTIPQTRGMSAQDESQVQQLDVLVFLESGSSYTFAYHTQGVLSSTSTPNNISYTLTLLNSSNGDRYLLVFLANLSDRVSAAGDLTGLSKDAALAKITFDAQNYCNSSGAVIRYLPMWGEFGSLEITPSLEGTTLGTVNMLRSVASVDVGVNMDNSFNPQGLGDKFYIKSVSLANGQAKGQAAPYSANYNPSGGAGGKGIVAAPSLPTPATIGLPISSQHATPDFSYISEIYVPEALNSTTNPISVVVEGIYIEGGGLPSQGEATFYRIELIHNNDRSTAQNLLRNHRYIINIENVYGPGYATFDIAMQEPPVNLVTQLLVDDSDFYITYITYNESYLLGVSYMELEVDKNYHDLSIMVMTDYTTGWTAKMSSSATDPDAGVAGSWLRFSASDPSSITAQGAAGSVINLNYAVMAISTGSSRYGYIHITAGPLKLVVTVFQPLGSS